MSMQPRLHSVLLHDGAAAVGKTLAAVALDDDVRITGVRRRGSRSTVPEPDYRFEAGDIVVLLGRPENLARAERRLLRE